MERATERYFAGTWRLERRVRDALTGRVARASGVLVFRPRQGAPDVLEAEEQGELCLGAVRYPFSRRTLWRFGADRVVAVAFEDGRPFHSFAHGAAAAAGHPCGADHYEVGYRFGATAWVSRWAVTGPRKDYVMVTRHLRRG
ncbi:MAG: DUF6314 family protein [Pseudomonadota bacterium]